MSSYLDSMVFLAGETLGGARRRGVLALSVLVVLAVLVPVVLVVVLRRDSPTATSTVLGLVLGLVLDLLAAVALLVVVSHRSTNRRLRAISRSEGRIETGSGRVETSLAHLDEVLQRQNADAAKAKSALPGLFRDVGSRVQATQNLFALVPPRGPVPPMVGYVASPDVLLLLVQKLVTLRPSLTIECGSGTSTLFLALAVQQFGLDCRIVSLENNAEYAESTRALLADHGVAHLADVRHAPLTPTPLPDHTGPWYAPAAYADLHDIGLVFVDGPPGDVGPQARYPLVPLLADRLAPRCVIVLDDMNRRDESETARRWAPQLEGFTYRYLSMARGAGVFSRDA